MAELYDFPFQQPDRPDTLPEEPAGKRVRRGRPGKIDLPFLLLTLLLLAVGLVMLLSASYAIAYYETDAESPMSYFTGQALYALIGLVALILVSFVPLSFLRRFSFVGILVSLALLLGVLLTGLRGNGAVRWIAIGGRTFQPSELVKAAVVLAFADWTVRFGPKMGDFRHGVLPFLAVLGVFSFLLLQQPHLSATIIILGVGALMMYAGGTRWYWFAIAIAAVVGAVLLLRSNVEWVMKKAETNYAFARIAAWLDPESQKQDDGWQIIQSLYAIGSGGLLGVGLGKSIQKTLYLPEPQSDFILAIIGEELGYVGIILLMLVYMLLIWRCIKTAVKAPDLYGTLLAGGIALHLGLQVVLNIAVVSASFFPTGVVLPFVSLGGNATILYLAEMGVVFNISRQIRPPEEDEQ